MLKCLLEIGRETPRETLLDYGHTTVFSRSVLPARAAFPEQVSPPAMLVLADDAALARLVIAAGVTPLHSTASSFPITRSRACPHGSNGLRTPDIL